MMEWISVKDSLPEDGTDVLMISNYKDNDLGIKISHMYRDKWLYACTSGYEVTHWMPLPPTPTCEQ